MQERFQKRLRQPPDPEYIRCFVRCWIANADQQIKGELLLLIKF